MWNGAPLSATAPTEDSCGFNELTSERFDSVQKLVLLTSRISEPANSELASSGFWGLRAPEQWGGKAWTFPEFVRLLGDIAARNAPLAGVAQIHGCLGAQPALLAFGSRAQQERYLPPLVRGERLSSFALTEPNAGADVGAIRARATRCDNGWRLAADKAFITNLGWNRTLLLFARVGEATEAFVVELPAHGAPQIAIEPLALHCLPHTANCRLTLREFAVPHDALLSGDNSGLRIAYHLLNHGRTALAAIAAGRLRGQLAALLPWVRSRRSQGQAIAAYPLVQRRLARLAASILGCELLSQWCAELLEEGRRGDLEGKLVKSYAADALRAAAVEQLLPTHGGRAFLKGNAWGDNLYDLLAPSIYEGESELLRLSLAAGLLRNAAARNDQPSVHLLLAEIRAAMEKLERSPGFSPERNQCELADLALRLQHAVASCLAAESLLRETKPLLGVTTEYLALHSQGLATGSPPDPRLSVMAERLTNLLCEDPAPLLGDLPPGAIGLPYEELT